MKGYGPVCYWPFDQAKCAEALIGTRGRSLSDGVYGYRRVHGDLREIGEVCSRNRVAKIMRKNRIQAIHGYKVPRGARGRPSVIAPNRVRREFTVVKPDQVWVTDITYIRTWQGWLYLAVVIDLFPVMWWAGR